MQQHRLTVPLVVVLSLALVVFVGGMAFGVNTNCTNAWSCTSSDCAPCRVVSFASLGGLGIGALLGGATLFSPWPRRGSVAIYSVAIAVYVVAMVATAWLTLVVAQTWGAPSR